VLNAYFLVLKIITFKGWAITLKDAIFFTDSEQMTYEQSYWICGYFVMVILLGSFFAFNLFTGVIIDGLKAEKAKIEMKADSKLDNQTKRMFNVRQQMVNELRTIYRRNSKV